MLLLVFLVLALITWVRRDCDLRTWFASKRARVVLKGKVVWITGASSGIGEHVAYEYVRSGAKVVLSARRKEELERVKTRCEVLGGTGVAFVLPLDVCDFSKHQSAFDAVLKQFGRLDVLVNNAGRTQRSAAEDTSLEVDRAMFELNYFAPIALTKVVLPEFIKQKSGQFVVISSVAGKMGAPVSSTYSATKHAIQGFHNTLRMEIADRNIDVCTVCPGPIKSEISKHAFLGTLDDKGTKANEKAESKMDTERCAFLVVAGATHKVDEVWIAHQPFLTFLYVSQYLPALYVALGKRVGPARVQSMKAGGDINNNSFLWNKKK